MSFFWLWVALSQLPGAPSGYEDRLVREALQATLLEPEAHPEGKAVEDVVLYAQRVFEPSDPWPLVLNVVHARTQEAVIRREVLVRAGETWDPARIAETERNLRSLYILAVAKLLPMKGRQGGVVLLVLTKDRWSLRLNSEFTTIGNLVQYLRVRPTEMNFRGLNQEVALDVVLRLDTLSLGESFIEPRLFGTPLYFNEAAALIVGRESGKLEGSAGAAYFGLPLRSLDQPWGFLVEGAWNSRRRRVFRGASIWQVPISAAATEAAGAEENSGTSGATVPYVYDEREASAEAALTRSFGSTFKVNVTGALGGYARHYALPFGVWLSDEQRGYLAANYLPASDDAAYLSANVLLFTAKYQVLHDVESYQLSEDFQLGPRLSATARWAFATPWTSGRFVEVAGAFRYRACWRDDLFTFSVAASARLRPGAGPANQRLAVEFVNASPPLAGGRVVLRLMGDFIANDLTNRRLLLGGSTGLRGTSPEALSGKNLLLANLEYRMRPFELATQWLGLVVFTDVGSAYEVTPEFTMTTGFGVRLLLPHFNPEVIRLDFGIVIGREAPGLDRLNASYGQVTELRPRFLDSPL